MAGSPRLLADMAPADIATLQSLLLTDEAIDNIAGAVADSGDLATSANPAFTGNGSIAGLFRATGASAGLGFNDRSAGTQWQLYASGLTARLFNGSADVFSINTGAEATISGASPNLALRDSDVTGKGGAVRFDNFYSSEGSYYNFLEGGGFKVLVSDANAGAFSSTRTLLEAFTNTSGLTNDTGSFFPNGGQKIGEDGWVMFRSNVLALYSTNNLHTADMPDTVSVTVSGGAITALTIESGYGGYTANLDPASDASDRRAENRIAVQGIGRSNVLYDNFEGYFATNGSGETTGAVHIVDGGENYVSGQVLVVPSPPPASTTLDLGPELNLIRDAPAASGSHLGAIVAFGRYTGKTSATAPYGQLVVRVLDPTEATADAVWSVVTVDPGVQARQTARWDLGKEIVPYGTDRSNVEGALTGKQLRAVSTDAGATYGPELVLDRASASPANGDDLAAIRFMGRNAAGASVEYGRVRAKLVFNNTGNHYGSLVFSTPEAGTFTDRFVVTTTLRAASLTDSGEVGSINVTSLYLNNVEVLTGQMGAIANATDAASTMARLNDLLAALRAVKLLAT